MSEQIEIKRAACKHCGEEIALIPCHKAGFRVAYEWRWIHLNLINMQGGIVEGLTSEECEPKTKAEPMEKES